jgi:Ca-activated chloride channel family protein
MRDEAAMLKSSAGVAMALEGVDARGRVRGLLFELVVEQRYRNPQRTNVEAVYTFPLPSGAVLLDLDVEIGDRKLAGVVVEKKEAERGYEEALDKGDTAIMLERAGDGLCTLNLGNLMAGERATIRYRYAELLRFEHGAVRLAIPTVIAPRYGDPRAAGLHAHQVPSHDLRVEYPFDLAIDLEGEIARGSIASPSHALAIVATATGLRVGLARGAFLDRDFVMTVAGLTGRALATVARDGEGYVALASFCADVPRDAASLPLTLKLVVDCSGSMNGDSIEAARRALHRILASLDERDRFSLTRFGSETRHEGTLRHATAEHVRNAAGVVGRMQADLGGTEMASALREVFALGGTNGAADVMILTDGEIWNVDELVAEARAARQRVFVVGIGSAPSEGVLSRLAGATGGACEFVAPNEDAEAAILRTFARLRAPRIERADVAWPATPRWTVPLPAGLFGGETIHALAGFDAPPMGATTLSLHAKAGAPMTSAAQLGAELVEDRTLARIAASRRLDTAGDAEKLRLALDYGLLTSCTNLLVVHERAEGEKAVDLPKLAHVAQMHAAGWHGVGSVVACRRVDRLMVRDAWPAFCARDETPDEAFVERAVNESAPIHEVFGALDAFVEAFALRDVASLPTTVHGLEVLGVPEDIVRDLRRLVVNGEDERALVAAFLAAVAGWDEQRALPALRRELRRAIRRAVASAKADASVCAVGQRMVERWTADFAF